jgi:hypothetical protein
MQKVFHKGQQQMEQPLDTDLEEMIKTSTVPIVTPAAAAAAVNYSFQRTTSSSNSSSEDDADDDETPTKGKKRARISKKRLEEEQRQLDEEDNPPTGLKTLGALLVVLFIVAAIVAVIGYTTWSQGRQKQDAHPPIRLWTEHHTTLSAPLRVNDVEFLPAMEHALGHYLLTSPRTFPCLCMHHLRRLPPTYQVCGVVSPSSMEGAEMLLLVNPHLRGRGNETDYYTERSVSCPDGETQRRQRYRTIILEWLDVGSATVQTTWARFEGPTAACLQLALDEMVLGDKHCRE